MLRLKFSISNVVFELPVDQRQGCGSDEVTHIASAVLRDYCTLASDAPARLRSLPDLSPHFACNFITAVSAVYTPCGESETSTIAAV